MYSLSLPRRNRGCTDRYYHRLIVRFASGEIVVDHAAPSRPTSTLTSPTDRLTSPVDTLASLAELRHTPLRRMRTDAADAVDAVARRVLAGELPVADADVTAFQSSI